MSKININRKEVQNMELTQKEVTTLKDLQSQEQTCIEKYKRYATQAKDAVLQELFQEIEKKEQKHYDSLEQVLNGSTPSCDCNDSKGKEYNSDVFAFADSVIRKLLADIQIEEQNHAEMLYKYKTVNAIYN